MSGEYTHTTGGSCFGLDNPTCFEPTRDLNPTLLGAYGRTIHGAWNFSGSVMDSRAAEDPEPSPPSLFFTPLRRAPHLLGDNPLCLPLYCPRYQSVVRTTRTITHTPQQ